MVVRSVMYGHLLSAAFVALSAVVPLGREAEAGRPPEPALPALAGEHFYNAFRNVSSHNLAVFQGLLLGRVYVSEHYSAPDRVSGALINRDGFVRRCGPDVTGRKMISDAGVLTLPVMSNPNGGRNMPRGVVRAQERKGNLYRDLIFYEPETGRFRVEFFKRNKKDPRAGRSWARYRTGWVQDSWPRVLADACPGLVLPEGMPVNERQTSQHMSELLKQDPDAPIRNFPGSEHTAPGRVGLAASNGGPPTSGAQVEAFMEVQDGNVLLSLLEEPHLLTKGRGRGPGEVWRLGPDGKILATGMSRREIDPTGQEWILFELSDRETEYYPVGYAFPYLPTGTRHPAFLVTDRLVEAGEPVVLSWMPPEWKDFTFMADGTVRVRRSGQGADRVVSWGWTEGRLWVGVDGPEAVGPLWPDVAERLGLAERAMPAAAPQASVSSTGPASGTGRCAGGYEGTAVWTLGEDGKKVWDISGCRKAVPK